MYKGKRVLKNSGKGEKKRKQIISMLFVGIIIANMALPIFMPYNITTDKENEKCKNEVQFGYDCNIRAAQERANNIEQSKQEYQAEPIDQTEQEDPIEQVDQANPTNQLGGAKENLPGEIYVYLNILENGEEAEKPCLQEALEERYILLEERSSEEDIPICLDTAINTGVVYEREASVIAFMELIIEGEASGQSLLGKILIAEELLRRTGGLYGADTDAIFIRGYSVVKEINGKLGVYDGDREITVASEESKKAMQIALCGSCIGEKILKTITERKRSLGMQCLDDQYYDRGVLYHYNPEDTEKGELALREPAMVPVVFAVEDHHFYGKWLNEKQAISYE